MKCIRMHVRGNAASGSIAFLYIKDGSKAHTTSVHISFFFSDRSIILQRLKTQSQRQVAREAAGAKIYLVASCALETSSNFH